MESLKRALVKVAAEFPIVKIRESIDDWLRRLCRCVQVKGCHFKLFFRSILYILDECNHQIYISNSIFPLLTFTFVTELMARLCIFNLRHPVRRMIGWEWEELVPSKSGDRVQGVSR